MYFYPDVNEEFRLTTSDTMEIIKGVAKNISLQLSDSACLLKCDRIDD